MLTLTRDVKGSKKGGALLKRNIDVFATHQRSAENALMFVDGAM